uniref:Uncharacterized protein n=1 Tax=Lutzomyia longipalpis TaxID=7200 RepID=A0A1B0CQK1_LUTLO
MDVVYALKRQGRTLYGFGAFLAAAVGFFLGDAGAFFVFFSPVAAFFGARGFFFSTAFVFSPFADVANLKEPDAPLPFVCTRAPLVTADFKYLRMNGASFSASTL